MKRFATLLLALALLFSVVACGKTPTSSPQTTLPPHIGTWYVYFEEEESDIYMTLNADNTAIFEETEDGSTDVSSCMYILVDTTEDLRDEDMDNFYCCYAPNSDTIIARIDGWDTTFRRAE